MHNHESFSLRFHKFQRNYTNTHLVAVGTQTVTINKLTLFFFLPPSQNNSFLDRMIADRAWGTDIFFSVVSHVSIGFWQSVCVCLCVCERQTWPEAPGGEGSSYPSVGEKGRICKRTLRAAMFATWRSTMWIDQQYLPNKSNNKSFL